MDNRNDKPQDAEMISALLHEQRNMGHTVLIVDDVKLMRMALKRILASAGYTVVEAEDGTQALETLQTLKVDLVIADIKMPDMDGFELVSEIRANPGTAKLPVLICTASKYKRDILHAVQLGVQGFLIKPISPVSVLEKMNEIFYPPNVEYLDENFIEP